MTSTGTSELNGARSAGSILAWGQRSQTAICRLTRSSRRKLPAVRAALEQADAAAVARAVGAGQPFTVEANGQSFTLTGEQVLVDARAPEGVAAAEDAGFLVAFEGLDHAGNCLAARHLVRHAWLRFSASRPWTARGRGHRGNREV